jgi:hypothetical protein
MSVGATPNRGEVAERVLDHAQLAAGDQFLLAEIGG